MSALASWLLTVMLASAPPARSLLPDALETLEEGTDRYASIADDIEHVVLAEPPLFAGDGKRHRTALALAAVAYMESGLRRDVDSGIGRHARGDDGRSCTLWQHHLGRGSTAEGWTCEALLADRRKAATAALRLMRRSFAGCRSHGFDAALRLYASGSCLRGIAASRARMQLFQRWEMRFPFEEEAPRASLAPR